MVKLRRQLSGDVPVMFRGGAPEKLTNQTRKIADHLAREWQDAASPQEKKGSSACEDHCYMYGDTSNWP